MSLQAGIASEQQWFNTWRHKIPIDIKSTSQKHQDQEITTKNQPSSCLSTTQEASLGMMEAAFSEHFHSGDMAIKMNTRSLEEPS